MLLMASKSLFNDTLRIHHSRWPSSSEVPELRLNPIICMTALRAHREISWLFLPTSQNCEVDKMTLCGKKHEFACVHFSIKSMSMLAFQFCVLSNLYRRPSLLRTFLSFIFFFWDSRQQKYKLRTKNRVKETSQRQKCFSCGWKKTSRETKCKSFRTWEIVVLFVLVMWTCGAC